MFLTQSQYENRSKEELILELTVWFKHCQQYKSRINHYIRKVQQIYLDPELQQCESCNSHLLTRIVQLECNAVTDSQYSRRETIELNLVTAGVHEYVFEESVWKVLSLTGVNTFPEDLHSCHHILGRVIINPSTLWI